MDNYQLLFLFTLSLLTFRTTCHSPDDCVNGTSTHTHSRRKRYVVFPEGSTYSVAFCLQWGLFSNDNNIFTEAVNWALSYDLPNATIRTPDTKRLVVPYILRRNRRDLYQSLEVAMNSAGLEGRTCIERGLCEAAQRLKPRGSLGEEILRVVFLNSVACDVFIRYIVIMDNYQPLFLILCALIFFYATCQSVYEGENDKRVSRRRRYVVFPLGSTFSLAFSNRMSAVVGSNAFISGMNWAVAFDLPNHTLRNPRTNRVSPPLFRRQKRELYRRLETAMDSAGVDGRTCIKKALCEAAQRLKVRSNLWEEIMRVLFTLPLEEVDIYEPIEHHTYDAAHRRGLSKRNCLQFYRACTFSLIDMVIGLFADTWIVNMITENEFISCKRRKYFDAFLANAPVLA
ncbi:hypothetical protein Cfor_10372 [Coptotermes formosanus]|uniref:Uncharacterized protein n=1 Tax=Coptotermes formosanus TaxID=36987 RepID=A0A6L2PYG1_COPFO|nr:hypothetical protein Cfor_10372 [Coptotermes formosanus]